MQGADDIGVGVAILGAGELVDEDFEVAGAAQDFGDIGFAGVHHLIVGGGSEEIDEFGEMFIAHQWADCLQGGDDDVGVGIGECEI